MNRSYYIWLVLFCSIQISDLYGQYDLTGQVVFKENQKPMAGVEIFHHESARLVRSDQNGHYIFENIAPGLNLFSVFAEKCNSLTDTIFFEADRTHTFELSELSLDLSEIDIVAEREELFAIRQLKDVEGTSIFAGKKTEVVVLDLVRGNLALNNARQVYAQVVGLNIFEGSDGGLQLNLGGRGLDPNRTSNFNTRQNGYDISADVLGYPENYYTPPSEAIDEVRILRGASSLQYGTQFGGLIDFKLKKLPKFKSFGATSNQTFSSFNTFNSFNSLGINKEKLSINALYNFKRGDGYRPNSEFTANNFHMALSYDFSDKTKIGLEYTFFDYLAKQAGGLTDEQFLEDPRQSTRSRNWLGVNWNIFNLTLEHKFDEQKKLNVSFFGLDAIRETVGFRGNPINLNENPITGIDEQDVNGNFISPRDVISGTFQNFGTEIKFLNNYKAFNKDAIVLIGGKYYNANNTATQGPGSTGVDANFEIQTELFPDYANQSDFIFPNLNYSLFAENILYLSQHLSLTPGLRFEHIITETDGFFNQVNFDNAGNPIANRRFDETKRLPRSFILAGLGLKYQKQASFQLIANISQNYRSVTFSDIRVVSPTFIVDSLIRDERGFTADIGIKGRIKNYISYDLTAYSVLYDDRIGIILDDRANRVRKNIGQALIAGTESLINFNIGRWIEPEERKVNANVFLNTAFTFSEYLQSQENNVVGNRVEFIPTVNLKTGFNVSYKNLELAYQFSYLSEQFTDVQNSRRAADGDARSGIIGEIPAYFVSDLTLDYSFKKFRLSTGINNLFDHQFYTRRATGYPGPGIIPSDGRSFFFTFGLNL